MLRLKRRAEVRADPGTAARHAFEHSAAPILDSSLTLITEQELYYRGHPVTALARTHTFEQVVALLWCGDLEATVAELVQPVLPFVERTWVQSAGRPLDPWFAVQSVLPRLAAADPAAEDLNPAAVRRTGARILLAEVACLERLAAEALLQHLRAAAPRHPALAVTEALAEAAQEMLTGAPMNVDLPLATLVAVLGLPAAASETLFIVARTAGWIAHALEQYRGGGLLRPRARYVGPVPTTGG